MKTKILRNILSANGRSRLRLVTASMLVIVSAALAAKAIQPMPPKLPWAVPTITVGAFPGSSVVDQATNTVYVSNAGDNTVSVIDGNNCSAGHSQHCSPIATIPVGDNPIVIVLDGTHHTLYASLASGDDDSITVADVTHCNAGDTNGCNQPPKHTVTFPGSTMFGGTPQTIPSGVPAVLALDESTHTLYVPDANDQQPLYILDTNVCNASTVGCNGPITTTVLGDVALVDHSQQSVYVARTNDGSNIVNIFKSNTCNSSSQSDCSTQSFTTDLTPLPGIPSSIDEQSHTFYLTLSAFDSVLDYVAVIDTSVCNATTVSGCLDAPRIKIGSLPIGEAIDQATKTVYITNEESSTVSVINGATCNAMNHSGCGQTPSVLATGVNPGGSSFNPSTHTLYVQSQDTNTVWVLDTSHCNATKTSGCTPTEPVTTVGAAPFNVDVNPNTHTVYVTNANDNTLSIIDASACNKDNLAGCTQTWNTVPIGNGLDDSVWQRVTVNKTTNTVYVANPGDNTLSVINGALCNASVFDATCSQSQPITNVGTVPMHLIVDEATNTIYVTNADDNTISVIDGTHCKAADTSQCGNTWPIINVGVSPQGITLNPATHTLYVANRGDGTVSVVSVNIPHCNKTDTSGCTVSATVPVGSSPRQIGVVYDTNTVFVGDRNDLTVSIFDGSNCNGTTVSGCPQTTAPAVLVGAFPDTAGQDENILGRTLAIDQKKHIVYVPNFGDSDVVMLDANVCRPDHLVPCHPKVVEKRMGGFPVMPALDPANGTIYVPNFQDGTVSLFGVYDPEDDDQD